MADKTLMVKLRVDSKQYDRAMREAKGEVVELNDKTTTLGRTFKNLGPMIAGALSVAALTEFSKEMLRVARLTDKMEQRLKTAMGTAEKAARAQRFLAQESDRLGISLISQIDGFSQLAAATRLAGMSAGDLQTIYTGVASAVSAMQMSSEEADGALRAIVQMISKGKVQAEELRGQLGERLPGAFGIFAKSLNVTTAELNDMLDSGEVTSDMLIGFAKELTKEFAGPALEASQSLNGQINQLSNSFFALKQIMAVELSPIFSELVATANDLTVAFIGLFDETNIQVQKREIGKLNIELAKLNDTLAMPMAESLGGGLFTKDGITKNVREAAEARKKVVLQELSRLSAEIEKAQKIEPTGSRDSDNFVDRVTKPLDEEGLNKADRLKKEADTLTGVLELKQRHYAEELELKREMREVQYAEDQEALEFKFQKLQEEHANEIEMFRNKEQAKVEATNSAVSEMARQETWLFNFKEKLQAAQQNSAVKNLMGGLKIASQYSEEMFNVWKAVELGKAVVSAAYSAQVAYQDGLEAGGPAGPAVGAAYAAASLAFSAAQIGAIASATYGGGGSVGGGVSGVPSVPTGDFGPGSAVSNEDLADMESGGMEDKRQVTINVENMIGGGEEALEDLAFRITDIINEEGEDVNVNINRTRR